ncbi:MAG TPA: PLP-dependent aspartate aminotransferase family protein [Gemmatimonadaceae bacterium]|nr:PLP-dependent aspartate aminotransferase family protein [Gemmatimonadaceae bacterium]
MPRSKSRKQSQGLSTLAIHGGREPHRPGDAVVEPLVQSVNHVTAPGTAEGLLYTRYGNTPNATRVQKRLALLEGAEASLVLSSGMGATACALLALLRPGDHLLASMYIYGGTHRLLMEEFVSQGIDVTLVDPYEPRAWRKRMKKVTRAIFVESPVNPTCRVLDLRPISYLTRGEGIALVVDSTFASPINFRPLEHGADVVVHSATKYLNGHHDVLAGVVSGSQSYIDEVLQKEMVWGQTPDPFSLWLLERGMKTLDVRVKRASATAMVIAEWAESRKEFKKVHYPGLASHPDHAIASETLDGFGGMLALELTGGGRAADRFLRRLRLVTHAASLGGVDTLVSEPRYTSHAKMTAAERARIGIPDGFMRFSIGLEDPDDLIADLEQALK